MSRPAQLEKQMQRVQEIQTEMLGDVTPAEPVITDPAAEPVTPPTEPVVVPVAIEPPVTVSKEDYDKLEQRYRTLQGMHAAEGTRQRDQINQLNSALQDLEDRLVAAERSNQAAAPAPAKYVTDKDVADYGDTLDMVRRAAREEAEAVSAQREAAYLTRIADLESQAGHVNNTVLPKLDELSKQQVEQVKADFWGAISTQVPDWRTINDDMAFKGWLVEGDPLTGSTRQYYLDQARQNYDASRVIRFFQEWKRLQAGGQTPAPTTANSQLEKFVAPGTGKGGTVTQPDKKQWTRAELSQFFKDKVTGKYAGREDEAKRIESDIYAAQAEGRIT